MYYYSKFACITYVAFKHRHILNVAIRSFLVLEFGDDRTTFIDDQYNVSPSLADLYSCDQSHTPQIVHKLVVSINNSVRYVFYPPISWTSRKARICYHLAVSNTADEDFACIIKQKQKYFIAYFEISFFYYDIINFNFFTFFRRNYCRIFLFLCWT